jgi:predicted ATP-binding protein involved in virulence
MASFQEKHNQIFEFLMNKRLQSPDLRFSLRSINRSEKLKKGYWFYGTTEEIYISFWNAWFQDSHGNNKQILSIMFCIKEDGSCRLVLRGGDKPEKDDILSKIAKVLNFEQSIGQRGTDKAKLKSIWYKQLDGKDYLKNLELFIEEDKPLIDNTIKRWDKDNTLFPFITEERFNETIIRLKNWQTNKPKTLKSIIQDSAKLIELRIENIKRFSNSYIDLDKQVICFYGKNGTGKTTLLRAIAIAMAGNNYIDKSNPSIVTLPKMIDGNIEKYVERAFIELTYTIDDFTKLEPCQNPLKFIPKPDNKSVEIEVVDTLISEEDNKSNLDGEELNTFKTLLIGFAQQSSKNEQGNIKITKPNFDDLRALVYEEPDNRFNQFISWVGQKIAPELVPSLEQRQKNREQINQIFSIISMITEDEIKLSSNSTSAAVVNKFHPHGLPLKLMSQGYQNIIGWVGFFMKRLWEFGQMELPDEDFMKMPAICLIDEIDTYLHPEWQYRILSVLVENFDNVQFIITSHSPFVLSSIPNDKILIYEVKDDNGDIKVIQETENLFGSEINDAAKEMGTTKRFKIIDEEVEAMFKSIYDNELEQADTQLAVLQTKINPDAGDLIKAATLIKTKKLLHQRNK